MTPAMAAGVVTSQWEMLDIVKLVEEDRKLPIEQGRQNAKEANERSCNPFCSVLGSD